MDIPGVYMGHFNPRSREGSDLKFLISITLFLIFQSTLPRGERLSCLFALMDVSPFQSTLPRGERLIPD